MSAAFDEAVAELYQAPLASFVAERKRLAVALKAAGHKDEAARFGKLGRPPVSAWVVNQLWWHARDAFDRLLEGADRLRGGDLGATAGHRDALAKLRARAATMLGDAGHGATEGTLRRVTQTLSAIAATGGFEPDPPGALAADRDPPGFDAVGISTAATPPPVHLATTATATQPPTSTPTPTRTPPRPNPPTPAPKDDNTTERTASDVATAQEHAAREHAAREHAAREHAAREHAARADAAAEQRRLEAARAKLAADRNRLEAALRTAKGDVLVHEREIARLETQLADTRTRVEQARAVVDDLQAKLDKGV